MFSVYQASWNIPVKYYKLHLARKGPFSNSTQNKFVHSKIQRHYIPSFLVIAQSSKERTSLFNVEWELPILNPTSPGTVTQQTAQRCLMEQLCCCVVGNGVGKDVSTVCIQYKSVKDGAYFCYCAYSCFLWFLSFFSLRSLVLHNTTEG